MVDVQPSALAGEVSEQGFSGQLGFCLDNEQPQASLMGALDEPFQQQQQGQEPLGELRSSSGECTSGESNTSADKSSRKESKESKHQGTSSEGLEHVRQGFTTEDGAGTPSQVDGGVEVEKSEQKEGEKAKLPRPVGPNKCPRCASDDTKFCYYNNYNIKQPRFFCKACQRYWTAGGSLRNVPVGAGKRKNKSAATREQEKAAAGAAKQAAASFEQFRSLLMDPTLAYSNANPRMALPGGFPVNPQMGPAGQLPMMMGFNPMESASLSGLSGQPLPNSMLPSQPQGSFGGAASSGGSEDGSFGGRRTRLRLDGSLDLALSGAMKAEGELLPEDQSDIKASGGYSSGFSAYQNLAADSNFGASTGTQPEWLNLAAAAAVGQQQAQMQHAQFQQAAALQQLQAAAAGWGQGQNMYGGLWPYNFYSNPYAVAYSGGAMPLMNAGAWNGMDGANGGTPVSGSTSTSLPSGAATSCGLSGGMSATMMPGGNPSNFWAGGNGAWPNGTSAAGIGPWSGWGVANQSMAANALMQQQQQMKQYSAAMGGFPGGQPAGSSMASGGSDNSAGTGANGLLPKDPSQLSYGPGN